MKYKKFSSESNNLSKSHDVSINSLDEIPLPNEIEIQTEPCYDNENSENNSSDSNTTDVSLADKTDKFNPLNSLNRLFKNIAIDDVLLLAILILLLQEDVPDELLIGLILIVLIQK